MKFRYCKSGQVWWANLNPTIGSEQRGFRPVYIVKMFTPLLFLSFPLTRRKKDSIWQIPFTLESHKSNESYIILSQPRTLDVKRLKRRIGKGKYGMLPIVLDRFISLIK